MSGNIPAGMMHGRFVTADDEAVAEEADDAEEILHDALRFTAGHGDR